MYREIYGDYAEDKYSKNKDDSPCPLATMGTWLQQQHEMLMLIHQESIKLDLIID